MKLSSSTLVRNQKPKKPQSSKRTTPRPGILVDGFIVGNIQPTSENLVRTADDVGGPDVEGRLESQNLANGIFMDQVRQQQFASMEDLIAAQPTEPSDMGNTPAVGGRCASPSRSSRGSWP